MTIKEATIKVLQDAGEPLSVDQIYDRICAAGLCEFKAANPKPVISRQLRKHCEGIEMKLASAEKRFKIQAGKFQLL